MEGSRPGVRGWSARQRFGVAIHAALVALLVPVYVLIAPVASWREPLVLAMLAAMAVVVDRHDVPLPAGIRFDALMAVALIAVAVGGPLPAFAVVLVPMVFNAATGHERLLRAGNLANLAAYGWYTLAGGLILQATAPDPIAAAAIGWLILAGLVQQYVNWAVGPAIYGPLWLGRPFRAFVDLLFDTIAAGAVMVVIGAVSVILMGRLDVFARAPGGALVHKFFGGGWSGWESLDGVLVGDPSAVSWGPDRVDVFVRGTDDRLWHKFFGGGWSGWEPLGGALTASPSAVSWGANRIDVFVRGADTGVWRRWWDGARWRGFTALGGVLTGKAAAVSDSWARIDLFARGADAQLWQRAVQ